MFWQPKNYVLAKQELNFAFPRAVFSLFSSLFGDFSRHKFSVNKINSKVLITNLLDTAKWYMFLRNSVKKPADMVCNTRYFSLLFLANYQIVNYLRFVSRTLFHHLFPAWQHISAYETEEEMAARRMVDV